MAPNSLALFNLTEDLSIAIIGEAFFSFDAIITFKPTPPTPKTAILSFFIKSI